jgi:DNA ligase 1
MKPMLAGEADLDKLRFPLVASPKLDGLRGLVQQNKLLSRSLKLIPNKHLQKTFGNRAYHGLDGELIYGPPNAPDVYRQSTSAIMRIEGEPFVTFWVFDRYDRFDMDYMQRRSAAQAVVEQFPVAVGGCIRMLEQEIINDMGALMGYENSVLHRGFEGLILRDPNSQYKFGRSSTREGILLKLKRFTDGEAEIIGFDEQMHNTNEATKNELGRTKRSTAKAGLVGKDTLGALVCRDLVSDVEFRIGTGMDDAEKLHCWQNQKKLMGKIVKYKSFKIGVKDAPRHPVFLGFRDKRDM